MSPAPQKQPLPPVPDSRIFLGGNLQSRDGSLLKGRLLTNCFVEAKPRPRVFMRPGLQDPDDSGAFGQGQGMLQGSGNLFTVAGATINRKIPTRTVTVSGAFASNVYTLALAKYPDAASAVARYVVTVTADTSSITWDTGGLFPAGCLFTLVNLATIYGVGGNGGGTGTEAHHAGFAGSAGGSALDLNGHTVSINNASGNIFGGGGGGGGGGIAIGVLGNGWMLGGGGGTGRGGGTPGSGGPSVSTFFAHIWGSIRAGITDGTSQYLADSLACLSAIPSSCIIQISTAGTAGDFSGLGPGGLPSVTTGSFVSPPTVDRGSGGTGGDGGDWGAVGNAGGTATDTSGIASTLGAGGAAGAAGRAIRLHGGTANFTSGNNPSQVKGAIS